MAAALLQLPQLGVAATAREQLGVAAAFDDAGDLVVRVGPPGPALFYYLNEAGSRIGADGCSGSGQAQA